MLKRVAGGAVVVLGMLVVLLNPSSALAQNDDDPAEVEVGKAIYEMGCNGCHGDAGEGVAARGRPLIDIALEADRDRHITSITDGRGGMPAFGGRLDAGQVSAVTSYVRLTFVSEEAAASTPDALADTGVETTVATVVGIAMVIAGMQLVAFSRRND